MSCFFCPGLVKKEDNEVALKINCGAFMDKSSVYFDTLDLYVDCAKTFVEGCDLLTKPKTEDHRAMLLVQSHWVKETNSLVGQCTWRSILDVTKTQQS